MHAVWTKSQATGSARLVLLAMADAANDDGLVAAYARSQSHFAAKARLSANSVRRAIRDLVAAGEVELLALGHGRASSSYRITLHDETVQSETPQIGTPQPETSPVETSDPPTREVRPPKVAGPSSRPYPVPSRSRSNAATNERFEEFWKAYPRRVGRGAARKAWAKVTLEADPDEIIVGAKRYAADPRRDPNFTAHPSTWLNAERWTDEVVAPADPYAEHNR